MSSAMPDFILEEADCVSFMRDSMEANSVDAIVTDPPYGLEFMNRKWDSFADFTAFNRAWATEALRVAKPGAYLLAFGGTRMWHRLAVGVEDAGWEIRDTVAWMYGTGFPKSLDIGKALDKKAGVTRDDKYEGAFTSRAGPTGNRKCDTCGKWLQSGSPCVCPRENDEPQTALAKQWHDWGTALKPAWEPVIVCRKPLDGTVAENVAKWGVGGINIGACRIGVEGGGTKCSFWPGECQGHGDGGKRQSGVTKHGPDSGSVVQGRFPANLIHDGSDDVLACFPQSKGQQGDVRGTEPSKPAKNVYGEYARVEAAARGDDGSAARFFYCAKPTQKERNLGGVENTHVTVKPIALMRYLCRLVTPANGVVLDPFAGSGSTGVAALCEGFDFLGVERDPESAAIARVRLAAWETMK